MASLKPIRLEKWTTTPNAQGDHKEAKVTYNLWAEVEDSSGGRSTVNGKTSLGKTKVFRVRYRPELKLTGNWRLIYDGMRYTVSSIEKVGQKRFWWEIIASGKT